MAKWICTFLAAAFLMGVTLAPVALADKGDKKKPKDAAEVFKKLDKDGNGSLSLEEFTGKRDAEKAKAIFAKKDKDGDGALSLEEFSAGGKKKKKDA
jgi:Ca2+-binding EF-hand superfamily protein